MHVIPPAGERPHSATTAAAFPSWLTGLTLFVLAWLGFPARPASAQTAVDFSRDVLPILSENCFPCHGPDAKTRKADLRLDVKEGALRTKDPVIVPGKSGESELILRITSTDRDEVMPPPKSGKKLTRDQIELLKKWIDQGRSWSRHWAFEPIARPSSAAGSQPRLGQKPDRPLRARPARGRGARALARGRPNDLDPPAHSRPDRAAADAGGGRRVPRRQALGLRSSWSIACSPRRSTASGWRWTGSTAPASPTPTAIRTTSPGPCGPGATGSSPPSIATSRSTASSIEQIAGDLLPGATLAQKIATGFNRNNRTVTEAGSIEEEWRIENAVDRVETTATVFLGLTMGCARCHDHKFDPISQAEFYQFLGFFNSVNEKGVYTETRGNVPPLITLPTRQKTTSDSASSKSRSAAAKKRDDKKEIEKLNKAKEPTRQGNHLR